MTRGEWRQFERRLEHMINAAGIDNACSTPDFILARHLMRQLRDIADLKADEKQYYNNGSEVELDAARPVKMKGCKKIK